MTFVHLSIGSLEYGIDPSYGAVITVLGLSAYLMWPTYFGFHPGRWRIGLGLDWADSWRWSYEHLPRRSL